MGNDTVDAGHGKQSRQRSKEAGEHGHKALLQQAVSDRALKIEKFGKDISVLFGEP